MWHDVDVHVHHALEDNVRPLLALDLHVPLHPVAYLRYNLGKVWPASTILPMSMATDLEGYEINQ